MGDVGSLSPAGPPACRARQSAVKSAPARPLCGHVVVLLFGVATLSQCHIGTCLDGRVWWGALGVAPPPPVALYCEIVIL